MDFNSIPDCVFLKMFRHLYFKDQVRVGSVSAAFRRMSKIAVSETKYLNFSEWNFKKHLTPITVTSLLNLCANRLEEVTFNANHREERDMLLAFVEYYCPNLRKFTSRFCDKDILNVLIRKNPQLEILVFSDNIKYPDVVSEQLETLHCSCNDECFESLMSHVPNLKRLELDWFESPRVLDRFLSTVPNLEYFRLLTNGPIGLNLETERMSFFWQLKSLTSLRIVHYRDEDPDQYLTQIGDYALINIAKSFPLMREIWLTAATITDQGVAALSSLRDLQDLSLDCVKSGRRIERGVRELAKCERLQNLRFRLCSVALSPETITTLLHSCRPLDYIELYDLAKVDTRTKVASFVSSLSVFGPREIMVRFSTYGKCSRMKWESPMVKRALKKLEEDGFVLMFRFPYVPEFDAKKRSSDSEMDFS